MCPVIQFRNYIKNIVDQVVYQEYISRSHNNVRVLNMHVNSCLPIL